MCHRLIHLLDPLIRLESLYHYVRKFHSLDHRRYVVVGAQHIPPLWWCCCRSNSARANAIWSDPFALRCT